jgi:hypothetical protein
VFDPARIALVADHRGGEGGSDGGIAALRRFAPTYEIDNSW